MNPVTLSDLGTIGSFLTAIATLITLIYLARQVKLANMHARYVARQSMKEHDLTGLELQLADIGITAAFAQETLSPDAALKMHIFLTHIMRQREWEWHQYEDGIIDASVQRTYQEVIKIFLCTPRTRRWWRELGRSGLNPDFVAEVDALLAASGDTPYWESVLRFSKHEQEHVDESR
jgi:hypothetical protein